MGLVADRVKETTTTTGTGDITLLGAATGFRTFNTGIGLNIFFYYALIDANGTAWETGRGYLTTSSNIVRAVIQKSSNADAAISLSAGTHTIFSTITEDMVEDLQGKIYASSRGCDGQ